MMLPIHRGMKPFPLYMCHTTNGTSNKCIVEKFFKICDIVERMNIRVVFISTDGDIAFDNIHDEWFKTTVNPILKGKGSFIEKIKQLSNFKRIPVSDLLHLIKGGRSHLINHLTCIDLNTLKCINMELFEFFSQLGNVVSDKSNISSMKDGYALKLFSWKVFTKLLFNQRYDACFYILPFLYVITAVRSKSLNKFDRLRLLELAIKIFYFHYNNVLKSSTELFAPKYNQNVIGTLFSDLIYIQRCINTCVAFSVALLTNNDLSFARIGTHDLEAFFGMVRNLSFNDDSFEKAVKVAVKSIIVNFICEELNFKINIRSRDNEGGASVNENILNSKCAETDFSYILDSLFLLFKSIKLCEKQIKTTQYLVDSFTNYLIQNGNQKINLPSIFSGTRPHNKYVSLSYAHSLSYKYEIKPKNTILSFYEKGINRSKYQQETSQKIWFLQLINTFIYLKELISHSISITFPTIKDEYPNGTVFNQISNFFKENLCQPHFTELANDVLRLDDQFQFVICDVQPQNSISENIIINNVDNRKEIIRGKNENNENKNNNKISTNMYDQESVYNSISQCAISFIKFRIPNLAVINEEFVKEKLQKDLKEIALFVNTNEAEDLDQNIQINIYDEKMNQKIRTKGEEKPNEVNIISESDDEYENGDDQNI